MTLDEAIHFAECLKHNYTINFADMEDFCDTVIESLKKEPSEDVVSRSDVMALIERTNLKYSSSFIRGISQRAFEDLLYGTLSLSPVIDFADKCRECGREKVLDKIRAEIKDTLYVDSLIFGELIDFKNGKISADDVIDEFNRVARIEVLKIIDKYKVESEVQNGRSN